MGLLLTSLSASAESRLVAVNSYAAAVNDRVIMDGDVQVAVEPVVRRLQKQVPSERLAAEMPQIFQSALNQLIDRALILEEFEALGYQLPQKNVLQKEQDFIEKKFDGDRVRFEEYLRNEGKTVEEWREELGENLRIDMLRYREVYSRIDISPLEVRRAYESRKGDFMEGEQVLTRLIEIKQGDDSAAARTKAQDAMARIQAGDDFVTVAKEVSEGSRAAKGGEMPKMDPNDLRTELKVAIHALAVGEVSPLIETESGFYIVKLEEREPGTLVSFADARENVERTLQEQEAERLTTRWLERLRRKHTVHLF
jgi:peptidyl-prolyl cis-trans isomerase SurA